MKTASQIATASIAAFASALTATDAAGTWVQLLPPGTFHARQVDGRGPFTTGDRADMEKIVATTKRIAGASDLVVDYDHQSVFGVKDGVGGRAPAAGWLKELQVRDDGIWGRVEWTEAAAAAIRAGEYRYLSPVMLHTKAGKVLAIRMAGLTNDPAFDLAQVAASSLFSELSDEGEPMDKLLEALGLPKNSAEDKVLTAVNSLLANQTAIAKALGMKDGAKHDDVLQAVNSAVIDRKKIAEAAGAKADASADDIVTAVASAVKDGKPDPAKYVPIEQVTELQNSVRALETQIGGDKAEEAVATAIKDGKLAPALKDWGLELAKKDLKQFQTFVGSAPKLTSQQLTEPKKNGDVETALDDAQLAVCKAMGLKPDEYAKTLANEAAEQENR